MHTHLAGAEDGSESGAAHMHTYATTCTHAHTCTHMHTHAHAYLAGAEDGRQPAPHACLDVIGPKPTYSHLRGRVSSRVRIRVGARGRVRVRVRAEADIQSPEG